MYVDDLFLTREEQLIAQCKRELTSEFEMKDLGLMHYFLGLEVWQKSGEIFLWSMQWTSYRDLGCRTASPWACPWLPTWRTCETLPPIHKMWTLPCIDGSLDLWCISYTRDQIFVTQFYTLNQFMSDPKHIHWVATKHVLRYVWGTITYGLRYTSSSGVLLSGYLDSDWDGSAIDQKKYLWLLL